VASITQRQVDGARRAAADPSGNVATLAKVLDVQLVPGVDTGFRGAPATSTSARMFGGHAMAQALLAAGRTVDQRQLPASLHCVMLRPGDASVGCDLEVEISRNGRAFATRRVDVMQAGRTIALVSTQWHTGEGCSMTFDDDADGLPTRPAAQPLPYPAPGVAGAAFDLRWADDVQGRALWFRPRDPLPPGRDVPAALAVYVSDLWLADTALRRMGRRFDQPDLRASTLEHSVWFHRPIELNGWSCLRSTAVAAQQGRAVVAADLRTDDGAALATVTQAVSLRDRPTPSSKSSERARSAP
jgi:acyl-CoA thioesterase-2